MSATSLALTTAIVYYIIQTLYSFYGHSHLNRPIVVCPVLGIVLGDVQTGLALGASLELLFMGITNIGGSIPSDCFLAATLVTSLCIGTGMDVDTCLLYTSRCV